MNSPQITRLSGIKSPDEIIAFAMNSFPGAEECAREILKSGKFCAHGTSLEELIDRFEETPWWNVGLPYSKLVHSAQFRAGFHEWIRLRRDYAIDRFKDQITSSGELRIIRSIRVDKNWKPSSNVGLGIYWALDCGAIVDSFCAGNGTVDVFLYATVCPEIVNWRETLFSRLDYLNVDGEAEIQLIRGSQIRLSSIAGLDITLPTHLLAA